MHQLSLIINGILESRGPDCRECMVVGSTTTYAISAYYSNPQQGILIAMTPRELSTSYVYHYTGHYIYIRKWGYGTLSRMTISDYMTISKPGIHIHISFNL